MLCIGACNNAHELTPHAETTETVKDTDSWSEAPFAVLSAWIEEDSLWSVVQYGGGCGEHTFELEAVGLLMKSLPPKQPIRWVHRSPGDPCRAMITDSAEGSIDHLQGTLTEPPCCC